MLRVGQGNLLLPQHQQRKVEMATDKTKAVILQTVQTGLMHDKTRHEVWDALEAALGWGAVEEIGFQTLSPSEVIIRVKGGGGMSRHFKVKVSEVL
jgi:hypothetical protein